MQRTFFLALICLAAPLGAQPRYDVLLRGGTVIDPKNNIQARRDVAIRGGVIAAVSESIPAAEASRVVDLTGLYVVPGLVDIHTHNYVDTGVLGALTGDASVYPDNHSFRACTTAMADAGSSGWRNFGDFRRRVMARARTRMFAFVNILGHGMMGDPVEQDLNDMDPVKAAAVVAANRDVVVGIKAAHYTRPDWGNIERALEAGRLAGVPIIVDFGEFRRERPFEELVTQRLRPGDIYTHTYLKDVPMLDAEGKVRTYLFEARKRGVLFDVGHGGGSFWWRQAVPATRQGFWPDSISTDLHTGSMNAGMKDIVNVMSKFLNLGLPLDEVVRKTTWNPARTIRHEELGHLSVGARADIAVLRLEKGDFGFLDVGGNRMRGTQRLGCELTLIDGRDVWDLNGRMHDDWDRK